MVSLSAAIYRGKTVLVTGHTGFKGSWLCLWLTQLGAKVIGYALEPHTTPNHFSLLHLDMISIIGDIRDQKKLDTVFETYKPDIVFHLAAQPLVRASYHNPLETYDTNIMGTLKLFEVCRAHHTPAIVNITSDKAYDNKEWIWGYRENDPIGGHDPYSSSKGCAELLTSSYRHSFFDLASYGAKHGTLLASCRAGNVIGGGDWSQDRLIPDLMRSVVSKQPIIIRNPKATRPWQHVLEPLHGYLMLGERLLQGQKEFAQAWNFGPDGEGHLSVGEVVGKVCDWWSEVQVEFVDNPDNPHEANLLALDCQKAKTLLGWQPRWDSGVTIRRTVEWYRGLDKTNTNNYSHLLIDLFCSSKELP